MNAKHLKRTLALVLIMVIMVSFSSAAFAHEASSVRKTFTIVRTQPANQISWPESYYHEKVESGYIYYGSLPLIKNTVSEGIRTLVYSGELPGFPISK